VRLQDLHPHGPYPDTPVPRRAQPSRAQGSDVEKLNPGTPSMHLFAEKPDASTMHCNTHWPEADIAYREALPVHVGAG
jgi:hypothetical protein